MAEPHVVSPEELARLDAQYRPIPSFDKWSQGAAIPVDGLDALVSEFNQVKSGLADSHLKRVQEEVTRAAAWNTGAIENLYKTDRGVTVTVALQGASWEAEAAKQGQDAVELFRAQMKAYDLVLDLATGAKPISEAIVRRVHEIVAEPQQSYDVYTPSGVQQRPLPKGAYKSEPNHVSLQDGSLHAYAPVGQVASEMNRLMEELRSKSFLEANFVVQAAYAHYCLAAIHPFADGNGRVARALASVFTYQGSSIPLYIFDDEKDDYFTCLAAADEGDFETFTRFVLQGTAQALIYVINRLKAALVKEPSRSVAAIRKLLHARGGLGHTEIDAVAKQLRAKAISAINEVLPDAPPGVQMKVSGGDNRTTVGVSGYRHPAGDRRNGLSIQLLVSASNPVQVQERTAWLVMIAHDDDALHDLVVVDISSQDIQVGFKVGGLNWDGANISPTSMVDMTIATWAERVVAETLDQFETAMARQLGEAGWRRGDG